MEEEGAESEKVLQWSSFAIPSSVPGVVRSYNNDPPPPAPPPPPPGEFQDS